MGFDTPDVAVIGAGIIGLSIARRLAQAGARVSVVDAGAVGGGASRAAAGMLAVGGEFFRDEPLFRLARAAAGLWPEFVRQLETETGVSVDYRECGAVERPCAESAWASL